MEDPERGGSPERSPVLIAAAETTGSGPPKPQSYSFCTQTGMNPNKPKVVVIAGPTASGKTSAGLSLGEQFAGEIVSADSVQIYRYLDVGSAKPTLEERARVTHHMIDIRDPDEEFSAGDYVREARRCIREIADRGAVPFVVGGTGLYIRLLLGGIGDMPAADHELRERLRSEERAKGTGTLHARLADLDPDAAEDIPPQNLTRIVRALEVIYLSGKRFSQIRAEHAFRDRPYDELLLCLTPPREELYKRIDQRVDSMIESGLLEEVSNLFQRGYARGLKSMQSLGYRHAGLILDGELEHDDAVRLMKRDTRRYAKRQFTWFRSEPEAMWFDPDDYEGIGCMVSRFLGR